MFRLPDEFLYTTALIATEPKFGSRERIPLGTGFFIGVPLKSDRMKGYRYFVTAKHVIDGWRKEFPTSRIFIRTCSQEQGNSEKVWFEVPQDAEFFEQKNKNCDIIVIDFKTDDKNLKHIRVVLTSLFLHSNSKNAQNIGAGCETRTIFIYPGMSNPQTLRPFVRSGHIAVFPDLEYMNSNVVLVEGFSFSGQSGAPVFVVDWSDFPMWRTYLLGVHVGTLIGDDALGVARQGISLVCPDRFILDILRNERMKYKRSLYGCEEI